MDNQDLKTLRDKLALKQKELRLIMAIDRVLDGSVELPDLTVSIVDLLTNTIQVELCMMFLFDQETKHPALKAISDHSSRSGKLQGVITPQVLERAEEVRKVTIWGFGDLPLDEDLQKLHDTIQVLVLPIILGKREPFGFMVFVRESEVFTEEEVHLLTVAEDHIDTAIAHGFIVDNHRKSVLEIDVLYQVDLLRDQNISLDELLNKVLQTLIENINAEKGFIMLYDWSGRHLEMRATTDQDLYQSWRGHEVINQAVLESMEKAQLTRYNSPGGNIRSIICIPLILNEQIIGVLGAVNSNRNEGFSLFDCRLLRAIGSQIDTAVFERRERRLLRQVLGRSVGPRVMERLLKNPTVDVLKPERLELSVLFADIRGSTALAERTDPELLVEFIKEFLAVMTKVILEREGTIDKFVGDEVMALFGAPLPQLDHARRAVNAGLAMQASYEELIRDWGQRGIQVPPIGVGIATGRMIAGEMGGAMRANYTVIGREANLGARICAIAKGGQVLISEGTFEHVKDEVEVLPIPGRRFKGIDRPVTVYEVQRLLA